MTTFEGGCHCGKVRFRVTADLDHVSECNCSMCAKKGYVHLIVPPEQFALVSGAVAYRGASGTSTGMRRSGLLSFLQTPLRSAH